MKHQKTHAQLEQSSKQSSRVEAPSPIPSNSGGSTTRNKSSRLQDSGKKTSGEMIQRFKCSYCGFTDNTQAKVLSHTKKVHRSKPISIESYEIVSQVETGKVTKVVTGVNVTKRAAPKSRTKNKSVGAVVLVEDILRMDQKTLEKLLKVNHLKGIQW